MNIQKLLSLSMDEQGVKTMLDLPFSPDKALLDAESGDLYALAERFYKLWVQFLYFPDEFSYIAEVGSETWSKNIRLFGTYYDIILANLLDRGYFGKGERAIPTPAFGALLKIVEDDAEELIKIEESALKEGIILPSKITEKYRAQLLFMSYIQFRLISPVYSLFSPISHDAASFGKPMYSFLIFMLDGLVSPNVEKDHLSLLACHLLGSSIQRLENIYDAKAKSTPRIWNKDHKKGEFSNINLYELALLASRNKSMVTKYGEKFIEGRFEEQLSLIFQTLGFYVIPTTSGSKTVDLICFPSNPSNGEAYSFLVEAKTSGRNYSLPTKDSRAVKEYINDTKKILTTLPPLNFVLFIGPTPSDTITKKLQALEVSAGLPIRYCHAQLLAHFRESLMELMPASIFREQILSSSYVLSDDFFLQLVEKCNNLQGAHIDFVKRLISVHKG